MNNDWETRVQTIAKTMPYPPTPDIAARLKRGQRVRLGRLAQTAALLLILAAALLLTVPEIRAGVIAFLRIGAVDVIVTTATPPAHFASGDLPEAVLDFPGETTLDDAQAHFGYPILLPAALGTPDRVYLVEALRPILVLAWLDANGAVKTSLHLLPPGTYSLKMYEGDLEHTNVGGREAVWLPNPHYYLIQVGRNHFAGRQVTAHALVWEAADGRMTYRLETNGTQDEARLIAASIGNG